MQIKVGRAPATEKQFDYNYVVNVFVKCTMFKKKSNTLAKLFCLKTRPQYEYRPGSSKLMCVSELIVSYLASSYVGKAMH